MLKPIESKKGKVSDAEWNARRELAAAYRLVAREGWTHLVNNHISLRVPGRHDHFLINAFGLLYNRLVGNPALAESLAKSRDGRRSAWLRIEWPLPAGDAPPSQIVWRGAAIHKLATAQTATETR